MSSIEFSDDDLEIEICFPSDATTWEETVERLSTAPIRVTHKPTGIRTIGEGQGNQIKNKARALELLKEALTKTDNAGDEK